MDKKVLETLPEVRIGIDLPQIPSDKILVVLNTPWNKSEKESVLGIVATAAIREGGWYAVPSDTFLSILHESPWGIGLLATNVINAVWDLADEELVEMITVNHVDYIVPTQKFAEMLSHGKLAFT